MQHAQPSVVPVLRPALAEPPDSRLTVRSRTGSGDETDLQLAGELDVRTVGLLREATVTHLKTGHRRLRLDLSGITWCDNASLYTLLGVRGAVHAAQGHLELTAASETVNRALARTGVGPRLHPCPGASLCPRMPARPAPAPDREPPPAGPHPHRTFWRGSCGDPLCWDPTEPRPKPIGPSFGADAFTR
ncbi:STAS domain-containing protein [Streptomyces sp. NPDC059788]|uniref:STAS domain-containing protein n=1 Tax=Streptomyces sp. NPDC059788 TaxID=3346948 RepID=UPI0036595F1E